MIQIYTDTITRRIVEYIYDHPGCTRKQIIQAIDPDHNPTSVSNLLGRLQKLGVVENRGEAPWHSGWYPVRNKAKAKYRKLATDLVESMRDVHHTRRVEYLAERLQKEMEDC